MGEYDLGNRHTFFASLRAASFGAATNGQSKDLSGSYGATVVLNVGVVVGSNTVILQDSDDGSAFATVSAANQSSDIPATITTANHNASYRAVYLGKRRHLRARVDTVGTSILCSATIIETPRHVNA